MITTTLVAALFSLALTLFILWANPYRFSNQIFALVLLIQTAWLGCVFRAMQIGASSAPEKTAYLEWWFRANAAVISFLPPTMWLLQYAIVAKKRERCKALYKSLPVFVLSLLSVVVCLLPSFVSRDSSGVMTRGYAYYFYCVIGLSVCASCINEIVHKLRTSIGIRRVELQFLALNAGSAALLLVGLNAIGNILNNRTYNRLSIVLLFAASALTACALLMHRVFNAREVFLQLAQRLSFALILSGGIYGIWYLTTDFFAEPFGLLFSIAVFSPIAVWLDQQSRLWFDITGDKKLDELRQQAIEIERAEPKPENLVQRFAMLLCVRLQTNFAYFLADHGCAHAQNGVSLAKDRPGYRMLCELSWATPESLERRRPSPPMDDLKRFLEENSLGLIVAIPRGSHAPTLLVALGARPDERPYTFPEIVRIQNLAELLYSILARARLTAQDALNARTEYLSMMSRGLAHDLKNLINPVSSFLHHTDGWFQPNSIEADVHSAARRATDAMTEYVRETLSFSDRLEPNFERLGVKELCDSVLAVISTPASQSKVHVTLRVSEFEWIVCDGILIQRMLGNIIINAIDASTAGQEVELSAVKHQPGWMRFEVRDNGCGIPLEHMGRIMDPYFTTKRAGDNVRGFGLGLTIAHKIALLHRGSINVQSKPGQPTLVTVDLPIEQPTFIPAP